MNTMILIQLMVKNYFPVPEDASEDTKCKLRSYWLKMRTNGIPSHDSLDAVISESENMMISSGPPSVCTALAAGV